MRAEVERGEGPQHAEPGGHILVGIGKLMKKSLQRTYMIYKYDFKKILLAAIQQQRGQRNWEGECGGFHRSQAGDGEHSN